jgi:prepilin-type N-terminal cleavage/methylation domain-containing protein
VIKIYTKNGFTLLEISLTIGILAIMLSLSLAISSGAVQRSSLRSGENTVIQAVRRAQTLSQNSVGGSKYGVFLQTGSVIVFSGSTFASRDSSVDQIYEINESISPDGDLYLKMKDISEGPAKGLVFEQLTGNPLPSNFSGTIILRVGNEIKKMHINGKGVIER